MRFCDVPSAPVLTCGLSVRRRSASLLHGPRQPFATSGHARPRHFLPIFAAFLLTIVTMRFLTEVVQIHPNYGEY